MLLAQLPLVALGPSPSLCCKGTQEEAVDARQSADFNPQSSMQLRSSSAQWSGIDAPLGSKECDHPLVIGGTQLSISIAS